MEPRPPRRAAPLSPRVVVGSTQGTQVIAQVSVSVPVQREVQVPGQRRGRSRGRGRSRSQGRGGAGDRRDAQVEKVYGEGRSKEGRKERLIQRDTGN